MKASLPHGWLVRLNVDLMNDHVFLSLVQSAGRRINVLAHDRQRDEDIRLRQA